MIASSTTQNDKERMTCYPRTNQCQLKTTIKLLMITDLDWKDMKIPTTTDNSY